jgi:hypothetical protein
LNSTLARPVAPACKRNRGSVSALSPRMQAAHPPGTEPMQRPRR